MLSKKGLVVGIFSAALVLDLGVAPGVALGKSASVDDLTTGTDSIVEELVQLNPGSTKAEVIAQARHVTIETGEAASEVLSQQLAEAKASAAEAARDGDVMLRGGGQKKESFIIGGAKHKGDVFYAPATTLGYEHGHSGLYYDTNTIIEAPGLNRYSHAISASKVRVPKGTHLQYVDVSQASRNKAADIAYHFMLNKPYNTLFASNKVVYSDKYNCSQLVWAAYKAGPGIDLDGNGGPGVYPVNILNSGWTITYYIYGG
ncbi:YiiX/YebB-like N1pC/P60 family cysteine hydrolase [Mobiluncus mulieris]|uniref:Uncharacterized protein n=1 Tax=Mobiluncus mulieris TaxID=2052 RepID=A0A7Y0UV06_9ACTO|nr:hypothetical protein [Mobiluncus mulieris]NMX12494.1 hypothetical protein [Mobiluncus mulieris]